MFVEFETGKGGTLEAVRLDTLEVAVEETVVDRDVTVLPILLELVDLVDRVEVLYGTELIFIVVELP